MRKAWVVVGAVMLLAGCGVAPAPGVSPFAGVGDTVGDAVAVARAASATQGAIHVYRDPNATTMTKAQATACAAQSDLNVLADRLAVHGFDKAHGYVSMASAATGLGCAWLGK